MVIKGMIRTGEYFDSVTLMQVAKKLTQLKDIRDAATVMGTKENKSILAASGMLIELFQDACDADVLIAVKAVDASTADHALTQAVELLSQSRQRRDDTGEYQPKSLEGALSYIPDANLALISVAGKYAGDEAMKALKSGLHVMIFSDNVPVETERVLKEYAREQHLLVMGPDCGTAIINGTPLAFANVVNRGDIGIVAASGTGLQEISSIISNSGAGISQAIGTGGRDVKTAIGGIMFLAGLHALSEDPETKVIVLVSKPPDKIVVDSIREALKRVRKPVVATFLGQDIETIAGMGVHAAATLEENALMAVALSRGESIQPTDSSRTPILAGKESARLQPCQRYIRGLFSGGTLCDETQMILKPILGPVYSNTPVDPANKLEDAWQSRQHTVVDLGDDEFTVGRPHPMIDYSLRNRRIALESQDPETAVILLDVVLGYGSNMNPGEELGQAISTARNTARSGGRYLSFVCSITGTPLDPQNKESVQKLLEQAGVIVMPSNAAASRLAASIVSNRN
jgi:FdrA protein